MLNSAIKHGKGAIGSKINNPAPTRIEKSATISKQVDAIDWPDPQPLPSELPAVLPFDYELLPKSFREWIQDITERIQCPPDFPAVAAKIALAGIVGRKIGIRPKRFDEWLVVPNLWGAVIGRPGVMKTPAMCEPLNPLKRLEMEAQRRFDSSTQEHAAAKMVNDAARKARVKEIDKLIKSDESGALAIAQSLGDLDDAVPTRCRFLINDSTVEKLGEILNQNRYGETVYRDELIGLLKSLDKEGHEGARTFYLEAWNGTNRYTYDRIGRGTLDIESTTVSIIGGIQPGPLQQYLHDAVRGGGGDDGLIQRFQLAVWPDTSPTWRNVDRWPDSQAKQIAYAVFTRLDKLNPQDIGAGLDDDDPDGTPWIRFSPSAQIEFDAWRALLEPRVRNNQEHPVIESHLAKYRSLIPSLALLIHLADDCRGPVGVDSLRRAIAWGDYLESHARRIYSFAVNPDAAAAKALARRLKAGDLKDGFTLREVYRKGWTALSTRDDASAAVALLLDLDWLWAIEQPTDGKPATLHFVNPKIRRDAPRRTDNTDKSPSSPPKSDPSVSSVSGDPAIVPAEKASPSEVSDLIARGEDESLSPSEQDEWGAL